MHYLESIEAIEQQHILATNTRPVIVHCNDLDYYFCKYHVGVGSARRLIKEYIVCRFLQIWNLAIPDPALVKVMDEHIPEGLPKRYFQVPLFGLKKVQDAGDLNDLVGGLAPNQRQKLSSKNDLLKLSFFDILTSNEDRKFNNYNLLLKANNHHYQFVPIDHEMCFNSGNLHQELYTITYDESLIASPLFEKVFDGIPLNEVASLAEQKNNYYLCVSNCRGQLDQILEEVPPEWEMNTDEYKANLSEKVLGDGWFENCWTEYLSFLDQYLGSQV